MKRALLAVACFGGLLLLSACGSEEPSAAGPDGEVSASKDSLNVLFWPDVTRQQVIEIASRHGLNVVRKRYGPNNAYVLAIDRAAVPHSVTATQMSRKLVEEYPTLVDTAYAVMSGPGLE